MPDKLQIETGVAKGTRGKKWLSLFLSCVLASVTGRLVMALFQVLYISTFVKERPVLQDGLSVVGPVCGIASMIVAFVLLYRSINKYLESIDFG